MIFRDLAADVHGHVSDIRFLLKSGRGEANRRGIATAGKFRYSAIRLKLAG
jgi:hypothetical protein